MKFSEAWLREWVNPKLTPHALCEKLTMSGLEVEELAPVCEFKGVMIGKVLSVTKHPEADKLSICKVGVPVIRFVAIEKKLHQQVEKTYEVDEETKLYILQIVCGASNVTENSYVPVAIIGATLPNGLTIKPSKIRGVESEGMLCSAAELGLSDDSSGLLILPNDAPLGQDLREYLELNDHTIDLSITPNRGDCLSIKGIAREISALTNVKATSLEIKNIKPKIKDALSVTVKAEAECPRYVGRVIRSINSNAETPMWLRERLRRSGIRSINAIVDITNYVMLELGQPMHAFDLDKIKREIIVRLSKQGEKIKLLDGSDQKLDSKTLVIADSKTPLAIAGVMGGLDSGVAAGTHHVFLESAYFSPKTIAQGRQTYQLNSDSAYRFERGIDPEIQREAIERATQLILEIAGGSAGPVVDIASKKHLPKKTIINLEKHKIARVLGLSIPSKNIADIFKALGFESKKNKSGWIVTVPAFRPDIKLPEDLIEEIARIYGYDKIPVTQIYGELEDQPTDDLGELLQKFRFMFSDFGYHEIISYSFVDKKLQSLLNPGVEAKAVLNPITAEMDVMRTNLWPGLISALRYNKSRQQELVRIFEIASCFSVNKKKLTQSSVLAGLISGSVQPVQWGVPSRTADFFDLKGDLSNLFNELNITSEIEFLPGEHPALHPGQTANIVKSGQKIGVIGKLHPLLCQKLDLSEDVYLFELNAEQLAPVAVMKVVEVPKFPEIRRDVAIIVRETVPAAAIQGKIIESAGPWLKEVFVFDLYQGKGVTPGFKSIALGLVLQDPTRTLVDDEVAALMQRVVNALKGHFEAELRS